MEEQEKIRFTPDELKELIDKGLLQFNYDHLSKLDKSDQAVAAKLFQERNIRPEPIALEAPILFGPGAAGATAAEMIPGIARTAGKIVPPAIKAGAYAVGAKMGHPFAIGALGGWLANGVRKMVGGLGEEEALAGTMAKRGMKPPTSPPALFNGTAQDLPSRVMDTGATPKGFSMSVPGKAPSPVQGMHPTGESGGPLMDEIAERVRGGVQNNFKGRVSIQKGSPYPGNISTESSWEELLEKILRETSQGEPSPLMFHQSAPQGMRSSVDKLKRNVARRKPR